jgi:hypothetical protein
MEIYILNIPKNYMLCDQVICRSVTVNCMQIQSTPITWTNVARQCIAKHARYFGMSSRANISESPLKIHKTGLTHGINV